MLFILPVGGLVYRRSKQSMTAKRLRLKIDSLNSLFATMKIPPRTYTTVAKRKYAPNGKLREIALIIG
jgi:hypothetical protein